MLRIVTSRLSLLFLLCLTLSSQSFAQEMPEDIVNWSFSVEQDEEDVTVICKVSIVDHWHINATKLPEGTFGFATVFDLEPSNKYEKIGGVIEPTPIEKYDELADEQLSYHEGVFDLKQKIKVLSEKDFDLKGVFHFQTCNDVKCLRDMPVDFTVKVKGVNNKSNEISDQNIEDSESDQSSGTSEDIELSADSIGNNENLDSEEAPIVNSSDETKLKGNDGEEGASHWAIFWLAFGSGFIALLTPCVFPMIPMTVSFFTKQSKTKSEGIRNAFIYGLSIIGIYVLFGLIVVASGSASILNEMSTNPWFNLAFFALLVVFAISFMGAFEIRMPNSWINKADSRADKGGLIGIFFMALVLVLVSFSCTGPILGALLVGTASGGGGGALLMGMFGFGLALAMPFALFAAFPGWMNTMPSSGGWLNTVKVVLGFLELALAFKFLSNADLAWQAHMLEREVFLAIWIAIFGALALYLFGKIMLPHDSPVERLSVGRALLGTFTLAFVIYMIPGLWGAPVKLINAFPPPSQYAESPLGVLGGGNSTVSHSDNESDDMHLGPQKLMIFDDYDKGLAYAEKNNKPLFVDFTGWNCVNCRKMEESVWGEPGIIESLRNDVVIVSLHVDERTELPEEDQKEVIVAGKKRNMVTIGDKWMFKQINDYNIAAQPFYVMQNSQGEDLGNGSADFEHHGDPKDFKAWLDEGLKLFDENK